MVDLSVANFILFYQIWKHLGALFADLVATILGYKITLRGMFVADRF